MYTSYWFTHLKCKYFFCVVIISLLVVEFLIKPFNVLLYKNSEITFLHRNREIYWMDAEYQFIIFWLNFIGTRLGSLRLINDPA